MRMSYHAWGKRAGNFAGICFGCLVVGYASAFAINLLILLYAWVFNLSTKSWLSYSGTVGHTHFAGHWPDWAFTDPVKVVLVVWPTFVVIDFVAVSTWRGVRKLVRL